MVTTMTNGNIETDWLSTMGLITTSDNSINKSDIQTYICMERYTSHADRQTDIQTDR